MSSFEQRLISEIEFRLERSPVEESDDDVQHDEDSAGQGAAPAFSQKLKHYKVFEGMPVTFSCKVHGDPKPKVGGWFVDDLTSLSCSCVMLVTGSADSVRLLGVVIRGEEPRAGRARCPPLIPFTVAVEPKRSSRVTGLLVQGRQADLQEERALQDQPRR